MGVATWQKCPTGKTDEYVWIENFKKCSASRSCLQTHCPYKKPEEKKKGGAL